MVETSNHAKYSKYDKHAKYAKHLLVTLTEMILAFFKTDVSFSV